MVEQEGELNARWQRDFALPGVMAVGVIPGRALALLTIGLALLLSRL